MFLSGSSLLTVGVVSGIIVDRSSRVGGGIQITEIDCLGGAIAPQNSLKRVQISLQVGDAIPKRLYGEAGPGNAAFPLGGTSHGR